ncbi:MAG: ATP-dependent RecD-like DNA helicase [Bacilli bacterium]|nr:ATP-dependent RecD-like DNA helicase [Bacilli bacterium]
MIKVTGKIRNIIYSSDNGYIVALFRVKKITGDDYKDFLNKTITVCGTIINPNNEDLYTLEGDFTEHPRYGFQFKIDSYLKNEPSDEDSLIEFLSSSLVKGCGEKTAKMIVDHFGLDAINIIKNNPERLSEIKISASKIDKIYLSICNYSNADDSLEYLKQLGFKSNEASILYTKYADGIKGIIKDNFYVLSSLISFNRLDEIYKNNFDSKSDIRINACIVESVRSLDILTGDTYHLINEIYDYFNKRFFIKIDIETFEKYVKLLYKNDYLVVEDSKVYLNETYLDEEIIADSLYNIKRKGIKDNLKLSDISNLLRADNIIYNEEQRSAIITALNNPITIISGGPGVGKTTIVKAIVNAYMEKNHITKMDALNKIALLAPTGRASKKLASSTLLPAQTIHRFLKWNKETDDFQINEYNKAYQMLVIVDEVSMLDNHLFSSLLRGLTSNIKLILVGDVFQLPSVGPGQILYDLIESNKIPFIMLSQIYRQSEKSYIPYLARDIKNMKVNEDIFLRRDDYTFIDVKTENIKKMIKKICEVSKEKGIHESDIQILAPMYKGENGIDNLNHILQDFFNPCDKKKLEITYGFTVYRVGDKVLQQINNPDCNVFNGDIGFITDIKYKTNNKEKDKITINFDGNIVEYNKDDLQMIKHAYAITIHKSQGSEFPHVIIPVCKSYNKMLYNKLIYTGVSRAKKSLVVIGEKESFLNAINNDYSTNRKTGLLDKLMNKLS